ncbi:MAG: hypothetical protein ABEL51_10710 [Salinibacter sp.]
MHTVHRLLGLVIAVVLLGTTGARAQLPANELEGTWRMKSQKLIYPDSVVNRSGNWSANFKILNSTHFAWGRETKDGQTVIAGGGRYEYYPERNLYIEHIQYHSEPDLSGTTLRFTARVEGDTWYHIGKVGNYKLREVWKRVDPKKVRAKMRDDTLSAERTEAESSGQ